VWLWLADRGTYVSIDGSVASDVPAEFESRLVGDPGSPVARVDFDPAQRGGRPEVLSDVLDRARLAFEIARLDAALGAQLAEVERSRAMVIEAGQRERRRLARDLHDGVQQRLVSLGIRLRRLQRSLPPQAQILAPPLDAAVDEIAATISDLRSLASGVRPVWLDDGLRVALQQLADSAPIDVEVRVPHAGLTSLVEETAYYVACEALANTLKHADASHVIVEGSLHERTFVLTVSDDGSGGADPEDGSGITGLADRLDAIGGRLTVESPSGAGTRIVAELPCES
jgi:signal transduction histidine kinase